MKSLQGNNNRNDFAERAFNITLVLQMTPKGCKSLFIVVIIILVTFAFVIDNGSDQKNLGGHKTYEQETIITIISSCHGVQLHSSIRC